MVKLVNKQGNIKLTSPTGGYAKEVYWNDILDKPFEIIKYYDEVIHDCNITEETVKTNSINYGGMELFLVKAGEIPTSAEDYIKRVSSISVNIGQTFEDLNESKVMNDGSYAVVVDGLPLIVAIDKDNTTVNGYEYPEAGFYVMHALQAGVLMYVEKVAFEEVFPIDERFLPEEYFTLKNEVEEIREDIEEASTLRQRVFNLETGLFNTTSLANTAYNTAASYASAINEIRLLATRLPSIVSPELDEGKMIVVRSGGYALEAIPNVGEEVF